MPRSARSAAPAPPPNRIKDPFATIQEPLKTKDASVGADAEKSIPDFTGMTARSILRIANERSLRLEITGSGKAVSQRPLPGGISPQGNKVVKVHLEGPA
ncbi:MAG: PASTA domain-containing protein [Deltaproteobacteria bacterium]